MLSAAALWPLAVSDAVLCCAALHVGAADHRNKVMRRACPQQRVREHERAQRVPVVIVYSDFPVTLTACTLCGRNCVPCVMGHEAMVSQPVGDGLSHRRTAVPLTTSGSHQPADAPHRTAPHCIQGAVGSSSDALRTSSAFRLGRLTGLYARLQHADGHSGQGTEGAARVGTLQRRVGFPLQCGAV